MTFGAHKLVHSEPFSDYLYEFWHLLSALGPIGPKRAEKTYRCTSTFSALNYCSGIFFKSLSYLYEVVHTNFSADFLDFKKNFERNFAGIVAPPSNEYKYCLVHLKGQWMLKKVSKQYQNRLINRDTTPVQIMSPSNEQRAGLRAWQKKKHTNTTFSHLQPARVVRTSPNFAWW